jgi:hypothetical protein
MKNSDIERWALTVINQVESHQPCEDSRVELKASWPTDYAKAACRIAGHANAARGERILWLIGVDESNGVVGANYQELSDWIIGVSAQFEGLAPRFYDLNVPTNSGNVVVALVFETDRVPYVVKNPYYGKRKDDPIAFEVPWRDGARTQSSTRSDLMLILSDVRPLRSLVSELEWNAEVASREGHEQEQFRTNEFDRAMSEDALSFLNQELRALILNAYIVLSNAQSYKRTLEMTTDGYNRVNARAWVVKSKKQAKDIIKQALIELRQHLGMP